MKTPKPLLVLLLSTLLATAPVAVGDEVQPININSASVSEIADALVGIGPVRAQAIIDLRELLGGIDSLDQLLQIDGIGPATLERNKALILLE